MGGLTVPTYSCPPGTDVIYRNMQHNERRLASTTFGCVIQAGASSDLGRANLIAGTNSLSASETVGAELVNTFPDGQNTIRLREGGPGRTAGPVQGALAQDRPRSEEAQAEAAPSDPEVM
jgi:hypothetical protein